MMVKPCTTSMLISNRLYRTQTTVATSTSKISTMARGGVLTSEEMCQYVVFMGWYCEWWKEKAGTKTVGVLEEGLAAYAFQQAVLHEALSEGPLMVSERSQTGEGTEKHFFVHLRSWCRKIDGKGRPEWMGGWMDSGRLPAGGALMWYVAHSVD